MMIDDRYIHFKFKITHMKSNPAELGVALLSLVAGCRSSVVVDSSLVMYYTNIGRCR